MKRSTMIGWAMIGVWVMSVTSICAQTRVSTDWAGELIVREQRIKSFGNVPRGSKLIHHFVLTNRSDQPIAIGEIKPSCGCTVGKVSSQSIKPNESATIETEMDTTKFKGRKEVVMSVFLSRSPKDRAELRLGVVADIQENIILEPGRIDFGAVNQGKPYRQSLTIEHRGNAQWRVTRMLSANRSLDAELLEVARTPQAVRYRLNVQLLPTTKSGILRDEIRIVTNDPKQPETSVMVFAHVLDSVRVSPSRAELGEIPIGQTTQAKFAIQAAQPFNITKIEGLGDGFVWTPPTGAVAGKNAQLLQIQFDTLKAKPNSQGRVERKFKVHLDLPGQAPVEVTASAKVRY